MSGQARQDNSGAKPQANPRALRQETLSKSPSAPSVKIVALAAGVGAPADTLRMQFSRSSGPGGQNVNKVNTKAELWIAVASLRGLDDAALERLRGLAGARLTAAGDIHLVSDTHRSQSKNRREVLQRLGELLTAARRKPLVRRPTRPSSSARRRRLESKRRRSQIKSARSSPGQDE